ncbi:MAG TPA: triphosphoribosyl-dephospho-CoA synthase [Chthoniobacteraceae bacterium]|nr:triphosphoribosyl-dephospho-CoA synthase [Chthoniobacteraceae bacterium]
MTEFSLLNAPCARNPVALSQLAVRSLLEELRLAPKPGLVSPVDNGSHHDMDAALIARSAWGLRRYFRNVAVIGAEGGAFERLREEGLAAERTMARLTGGVNTHRGAIFSLGLLVAAGMSGEIGTPFGAIVQRRWGRALAAAGLRAKAGKGALAAARAGVAGARAEAINGFPALYRWGLPALREAERFGRRPALVHLLFSLIARLDDTNLLHRGGLEGLNWARQQAAAFLDRGSIFADDWEAAAWQVHREFVKRWLSPGGSADLLAATLWVDAVEGRGA